MSAGTPLNGDVNMAVFLCIFIGGGDDSTAFGSQFCHCVEFFFSPDPEGK